MKKLLLHTCCGPCAAGCIDRSRDEGYEPTIFFSNSNISPYDEYLKRLEEAKKVAAFFKIDFIEDEYNHNAWLAAIKGLEREPERGGRCTRCFAFAFQHTDNAAKQYGFNYFTTTLSVSPYKSSKVLFAQGAAFDRFVPIDFKKRDGYKKSLEISKQLDLYRQDYCGCEFSLR